MLELFRIVPSSCERIVEILKRDVQAAVDFVSLLLRQAGEEALQAVVVHTMWWVRVRWALADLNQYLRWRERVHDGDFAGATAVASP